MVMNIELKSGVETLIKVAKIATECGVREQITIKTSFVDDIDTARVQKLLHKCPDPVDFIPTLMDSRDGLEKICRDLRPNCVECVVDHSFGVDPTIICWPAEA